VNDWASTARLATRVILAEGPVIQGQVHLQPRVAWRDGPETPLELLNREGAFFPVSLANGQVIFVAKAQVAALSYADELGPPDPDRETAARHIPLHVMMVGGAEFRGIANSELPPTRARALDFLNLPETFFALLTDSGTVCLNRRHVRAVRPVA
jgi:hypothetical protein